MSITIPLETNPVTFEPIHSTQASGDPGQTPSQNTLPNMTRHRPIPIVDLFHLILIVTLPISMGLTGCMQSRSNVEPSSTEIANDAESNRQLIGLLTKASKKFNDPDAMEENPSIDTMDNLLSFTRQGYLDLITCAWGLNDPMQYFQQNADGSLTDVAAEAGSCLISGEPQWTKSNHIIGGEGRGSVIMNDSQPVFYPVPSAQHNNWICVKLEGAGSNRAAIGAKVKVQFRENGIDRAVFREVNAAGSFAGSSLGREIGIGEATMIEEISITWPAKRATQVIKNVPPRQFLYIKEGDQGYESVPLTFKKSDGKKHLSAPVR